MIVAGDGSSFLSREFSSKEHTRITMPPESNPEPSFFLRSLAAKLSSLSETEISLLSDDALTSVLNYELSRLPKDEFNRLLAAEISPFLPIVQGVIQAWIDAIFSPDKPISISILKPKPKEEEQTSHSITSERILFFLSIALPALFNLIFLQASVRSIWMYLDKREVTTIAPQRERLIPSNRPIFCSKYSRSADVQGLKGIRYLRKAETVFRFRQKVEQHQEGTSGQELLFEAVDLLEVEQHQEGTSRAVAPRSRSTADDPKSPS